MHHVFCGLHVLHNLGIYSEKALLEWEEIAEDNNGNKHIHGGFHNSTRSRSYDLLFEVSKLLSYSHGDQKSGKADQWEAYLKKIKSTNFIVSFLHHRFNILFLLGGAFYFHRHHIKDFLESIGSENFPVSSVRVDINHVVFAASSRALGIMDKLVKGPLFRKVVQSEHIFDLNSMWKELVDFPEYNSNTRNAQSLLSGVTIFDETLITKDLMYEKLFEQSGDSELNTLTIEALTMINCTCLLMVRSQLKDQLPGGKYYNPSLSVRKDLEHCPTTNIVSERDFAQFDQKLTQKPTLSTIAACGLVMFNNNKTSDWLNNKSNEEIERLVTIARTNAGERIAKYKQQKQKILEYKKDKMAKSKLQKEINTKKDLDQKETLTNEIQKVGGLIKCFQDFENIAKNKTNKELKEILRNQIQFRKTVLCQKVADKKLLQVGEKVNGKYQLYDTEQLKKNLKQILEFSDIPTTSRTNSLVSLVRNQEERTKMIESKTNEILSKGQLQKQNAKTADEQNEFPQFFGKYIRHLWTNEDGIDTWYKGIVAEALDDEQFVDCEYNVLYEGFQGELFTYQLAHDFLDERVIVDGKASLETCPFAQDYLDELTQGKASKPQSKKPKLSCQNE